jgi:two-component system, OmpR family, phosphate regulon sensor histidine kinase PhoR
VKKACIFAIILITTFNVLSVLLIDNMIAMALVCSLITGGGVAILYFYLMKSIIVMEKQLHNMEEENFRVESIRRSFVANVTHELNTPLTSISGFIETLQEGAADDPDTRTKFLDIIAIETARLQRLIEDLLVLSEIENKRESTLEMINIKYSVEKTVELVLPIAEKRGIAILVDVDHTLTIEGNEDRFIQMMMNLIENAVKYSNENGRVWVNGHREAGHIVISVKDEGIGIDRQHQERLFERFYRVDKSRSRKVGGTGLGLSIVKHIAALFDAELKLESEPGKGSTFKLIF